MKSSPVRGTRDILPKDMALRDAIEEKIKDVYKRAGYQRIATPEIEDLDLLLSSDGGENLKMLFTIAKRGEKLDLKNAQGVRDICDSGLRFDLTLPLSRFFSNNKEKLESPFKSIQIGNVFRAERPQKGRYRLFKQCDIDIIGDHTIAAEIDLIHTTAQALLDVGIKDFVIKISDRRLLNAFILSCGFSEDQIGSVAISLDKLDKIGPEGVKEELVKKGFDIEKINKLISESKDMSLDRLETLTGLTDVVDGLKRIISAVRATSGDKYDIVFDFSLVRGMGYYTGPVFEISAGSGASIAGGGRYDEMIGKTSKQSVPAVGFSIGFERLVDLLTDIVEGLEDQKKILLLCDPNKDEMSGVIAQADKLRAEGYTVNMVPKKKNLGKQINKAREDGYKYLFIYGRDTAPVDL